MTYAGTCTRIYTPRGMVAHLSEPGWDGGRPLCPAPEPAGGWLGTGSQDEYEKAASLRLCVRCGEIAAKRGAPRDGTAAVQEQGGNALPPTSGRRAPLSAAGPPAPSQAARAGAAEAGPGPGPSGDSARPAGHQTPAGAVLDGQGPGGPAVPAGLHPPGGATAPQPGLSGQSFLDRWRKALSGAKAAQRGDRGRRARRAAAPAYRPGQNRTGGGG